MSHSTCWMVRRRPCDRFRIFDRSHHLLPFRLSRPSGKDCPAGFQLYTLHRYTLRTNRPFIQQSTVPAGMSDSRDENVGQAALHACQHLMHDPPRPDCQQPNEHQPEQPDHRLAMVLAFASARQPNAPPQYHKHQNRKRLGQMKGADTSVSWMKNPLTATKAIRPAQTYPSFR